MRRAEILNGVQQVSSAISESEIREKIEIIFPFFAGRTVQSAQTDTRRISADVLSSLKKYSTAANSFNDAARNVVEIFGLTDLEDPSFWSLLVDFSAQDSASSSNASKVFPLRSALNFTTTFLPKILALLRQNEDIIDETQGKMPPGYEGMEVLSLLLAEDSKHLSSPQRLIDALESVQIFYEVCSIIHGDEEIEPLSVLSCDSGSDKSFDLLGTKEVVSCVKELILSLWDRVVYYRESKNERMIEGIQKSLPVLEKIADMEQEQTLSPEAAESLRRKILPSVEKFVGAGVITPEIQVRTVNEPRRLLAASPKLLTRAPIALLESVADSETQSKRSTRKPSVADTPTEEAISEDETNLNNLNAKEQAQFKKLLRKMGATGSNEDDAQ